MTEDYIVHASGADGQVRIYAATTKHLVEKARMAHDTTPVVTAALGRLLTAGTMMGSMMKGEKDILTLRIKGDGPVGSLTVTARSNGNVKGYAANPAADLPELRPGKLDVGGAIGRGTLTVIRDLGMNEPYSGSVDLVSGEIAEDLSYYYAVSEQIGSCVALGVLVDTDWSVKQAGGFILQMMPFAQEELISRLEKNIAAMPPVTTLLERGETPESMIRMVMEGYETEIYERLPADFVCDCSRERVERSIISIGRKDLQEIIDDGEDIEVNCQFCGKHYWMTTEELKNLLRKMEEDVSNSVDKT
jgi:molecular chaperone Hsp33